MKTNTVIFTKDIRRFFVYSTHTALSRASETPFLVFQIVSSGGMKSDTTWVK